ncbi:hypothetical protein [Cohaesibacter intestini]|uniref:hypothetical protein n=1 Tax=Cohaesibacter intestini TaxID=2211145 RepID=UPI0018E567B9|nr:hypothetical protein [Cohaesibacter intestini]
MMAIFVTSRAMAAFATFAGLAAILAVDLSNSKPLNPYSAPAAIALGSNEAASGAFCALVPPSK